MRLSGMKAICNYYGRSESTLLDLIRDEDFPAAKIDGGIWESDSDLIEKWRKDRLEKKLAERRSGATPRYRSQQAKARKNMDRRRF